MSSTEPTDPGLDAELVPADDAAIGRGVRISIAILAGLGAVAGLIAVLAPGAKPVEEIKSKDLTGIAGMQPSVQAPRVVFRDETQARGIGFERENGARGEKLLPETMGGGAAFFDYDGDGDQDLLLVNGCGWPHDAQGPAHAAHMALFANDGKGHFTDVTAAAGLAVPCYGMGPAVGDIDGDGDVDLFLATVGPNLLFRNDGGRFTSCAAAAGVAGAPDRWSSSAGFFDYDRDGDLDLFVCNYVEWSRAIDTQLAFTLNGRDRSYGPPMNYRGTHCYLYRNDGRGRFEDVSAAAGIQVANTTTGAPVGKALALVFHDFDRDGHPDVVVANDTVRNFLFRNRGDGTFEELGMRSGIGFDSEGHATGAMGIDVARYRNDDTTAVAIGNFANEMSSLFVAEDGKLLFSDEANVAGIGSPSRLRLSFGLFFFDYDLDGRLDLLQANGHIEDSINQIQPSQTHAQPTQLFWNAGDAGDCCFQVVSEAASGDLGKPLVGRAACYADVDGDLDLDVLVTQPRGPPRLLINTQDLGHRALRLRLRGTTSNRDAIGARVVARVAGRVLERWVAPTRSYLAQVELPVTIGLGGHQRAESVTVYWPSGAVQQVGAVAAGQVFEVVEPR